MKSWRLQRDRDARGRSGNDRGFRWSSPGVESLESRMLLSGTKAAVTEPAAYKPPPSAKVLFPPYDISEFVTSATDGGGSNQIFGGTVAIGGVAPPFSVVWLAQGTRPGYFLNVTQANVYGQYAFVVPVNPGATVLRVFAENSLQDYSNIEQLTVNRGNPIEAWDAIALHAIQVQGLPAAEAARDLAIVHAAQYDAVADVTDPASAYRVRLTAPAGASAEAAADSSAYTALTALLPAQAPLFAAAEKAALAGLPNTQLTFSSLNFGQSVANQTLANRANDGSGLAPVATVPSTDVSAAFANVTPFEIAGSAADRPVAPPIVGSTAYDQALAQVSALGRVDSPSRTVDQTAAALFWDEDNATVTDPAHWNAIAEQLTTGRKDSLIGDAALFVRLDFALADAGIAVSDSQVAYQEARPLVAVRAVDPTFFPLLPTPPSPSFVSDHAAYAAAAADVLDSAIGPKVGFSDASESGGGSPAARSFASFDAAAAEDGTSQVWGGVNFAFDVQAGQTLGQQVGQAVLAGFPKTK